MLASVLLDRPDSHVGHLEMLKMRPYLIDSSVYAPADHKLPKLEERILPMMPVTVLLLRRSIDIIL